MIRIIQVVRFRVCAAVPGRVHDSEPGRAAAGPRRGSASSDAVAFARAFLALPPPDDPAAPAAAAAAAAAAAVAVALRKATKTHVR